MITHRPDHSAGKVIATKPPNFRLNFIMLRIEIFNTTENYNFTSENLHPSIHLFLDDIGRKIERRKNALELVLVRWNNPDGGEVINSGNSTPRKYKIALLLVVVSLLLHIFVAAKLFLYQRILETRIKAIEIGCISSPTMESYWLDRKDIKLVQIVNTIMK